MASGPVAWAAEPGLRMADHRDWTASLAVASRASRSGAAEEHIDVNPEEVTIRAVLEVGYRIPQDA